MSLLGDCRCCGLAQGFDWLSLYPRAANAEKTCSKLAMESCLKLLAAERQQITEFSLCLNHFYYLSCFGNCFQEAFSKVTRPFYKELAS